MYRIIHRQLWIDYFIVKLKIKNWKWIYVINLIFSITEYVQLLKLHLLKFSKYYIVNGILINRLIIHLIIFFVVQWYETWIKK